MRTDPALPATNFAGTATRETAQEGNPWHVRDRA